EQFEGLLEKMRGDRPEEEFLLHGERIGPYLTCRRGLDFERANRDWCQEVIAVLRARSGV
ncbi:PadR family transcriptional regulator, partial [Streptomyces sp. MBT57]|nr:PadR family transcriptional regulator [Streptomyces sp. MBT57]